MTRQDYRSSVKSKTIFLVWNEDFTFVVPTDLREVSLTVDVMDHDMLSANDHIGHVSIKLKSLFENLLATSEQEELYLPFQWLPLEYSKEKTNESASSPGSLLLLMHL